MAWFCILVVPFVMTMQGLGETMTPELIVALDVPSAADIPRVLSRLPDEISWFKVGLELYTREGERALSALRDRQKNVFLDLKLHDIPRTVAHAVRSAASLRVSLLTIHASGGREMLRAAAEAARESDAFIPRLVAVTTLTSLGPEDMLDLGIGRTLAEQALALGQMALTEGIDGLVTSVHEAPALRRKFGHTPILVTPGIRPAGADADDQKRIATPAMAVKAGATYLVVGRPILEAADPRRMAVAILDEMRQATA